MSRQIQWQDALPNSGSNSPVAWQDALQNNTGLSGLINSAQNPINPNANPNESVMQQLTDSVSPGSQVPTASQSLGAMESGFGKYALGLLSNPSIGSDTIDPRMAQDMQSQVQNIPKLPIANYPIQRKLGIPNTPMLNALSNATQSISPLVLAIGVHGFGSSPTSVETSIPKLSTAQQITEQRRIADATSKDMYNSKNVYDDAIPNGFNQNNVTITKPLKIKSGQYAGSNFSVDDLNNLKKYAPQHFQEILPYISKNEGISTPLENYFGKDFDDLNNITGVKKYIADADSNFNVGGIHYLSKDFNRLASGQSDPYNRNLLFKYSQKLKDDLIIPTLKREDAINNTKVAPEYQQADDYWKNTVLPFSANSKIESISNNAHNSASDPEILSAINSGQQAVNDYQRDKITNDKLPMIPQNHYLSQLVPTLQKSISGQNLKNWGKKTALGSGTLGLGALINSHYKNLNNNQQ